MGAPLILNWLKQDQTMICFLITWIIVLHLFGGMLFAHFMDTMDKDKLKLFFELPAWIKIPFICLWPYIIILWFIPGKKLS